MESNSEEKAQDLMHQIVEFDDEFEEFMKGVFYNELKEEEDLKEDSKNKWGGSKPSKAPNKKQDFSNAYKKVLMQFFSSADSIYDEDDFECQFHMPRSIYNRIQEKIIGKGSFVQCVNAVIGELLIRQLVQLVACLRHLAYGNAYDRENKNLHF